MAILSLPLIEVGQLSVTPLVLVNSLKDLSLPRNIVSRLTNPAKLDLNSVDWAVKTSGQTKRKPCKKLLGFFFFFFFFFFTDNLFIFVFQCAPLRVCSPTRREHERFFGNCGWYRYVVKQLCR